MDKKLDISYLRFRYFKFMWIIFILFHMAISLPAWSTVGDGFLNPSNHVILAVNLLVVVGSLLSLYYPRKHYLFFGVIICFALAKIDALPFIANHLVLALIIHLTILVSLLLYWDSSKSIKERIKYWFDKTAPYLRVELLILYFFVVLHKLNVDYFDPSVSCSVGLYTEILAVFPFLPEGMWINWSVIIGTLLFELMIPVFLIIPVTRNIGVFAGLVFHLLLSLHPNLYILSFSAELYALYILFLPGQVLVRIHGMLSKVFSSLSVKRLLLYLFSTAIILVAGYVMYSWSISDAELLTHLKENVNNIFVVVHGVWILWGIGLTALAYFIFQNHWLVRSESFKPILKLSWSPLLLFVLLTFFNGITPYVGFKTSTNFSMFSNLKMEGENTNHLFMPTLTRLSDIQTNTVTLFETDDPYLQNYIQRNERITYFELTRYLYNNLHKDIHISYRKDNQTNTILIPEQPPEKWLKSSYLERKLLNFRGVPASGPTPCQW